MTQGLVLVTFTYLADTVYTVSHFLMASIWLKHVCYIMATFCLKKQKKNVK